MSEEVMVEALRASGKYTITPTVARTVNPQQTSTPKSSKIDMLKQMTESIAVKSKQMKQSPSAGVCQNLFDGTGVEGGIVTCTRNIFDIRVIFPKYHHFQVKTPHLRVKCHTQSGD